MAKKYPRVFAYVVDRDFGFAPNPFHSICSLATCKSKIRGVARTGDWIVGIGGKRLKASGRCIFAMRVDRILSFEQYWADPDFFCKRSVRNGSKKMLLGDNIYSRGTDSKWIQADSHHSNEDGSVNLKNLKDDTSKNAVLLSRNFYYFGQAAPAIPSEILTSLKFVNRQGHRNYEYEKEGHLIIDWLNSNYHKNLNRVISDPFDFSISSQRYNPGKKNSVDHIY